MLIRLITQSEHIRIRFEYTNRIARLISSRAIDIDVMFVRCVPYGNEERRNHGEIDKEQAHNLQPDGYAPIVTNTHGTPPTRTYAKIVALGFDATHGSAHTHTNFGFVYNDASLFSYRFYGQCYKSARGVSTLSSPCNACAPLIMRSRRVTKETRPSQYQTSNTEAKEPPFPSPRLVPPFPSTDTHTHNELAIEVFRGGALTRCSVKVAPTENFAIPLFVFEEVTATGGKAEMLQGSLSYVTKKTTLHSSPSTALSRNHKQPRPRWSTAPQLHASPDGDSYASPYLGACFQQNAPLKPRQKIFTRLILWVALGDPRKKGFQNALPLAPIPDPRGGGARIDPKARPSRTETCLPHLPYLPSLPTCCSEKQCGCHVFMLNESLQKNHEGPSQYLKSYKAQRFDSLKVVRFIYTMQDTGCTHSLPPTHHQHGRGKLGSPNKQWQGKQESKPNHKIRVCHPDPYVKATCRHPPPHKKLHFLFKQTFLEAPTRIYQLPCVG